MWKDSIEYEESGLLRYTSFQYEFTFIMLEAILNILLILEGVNHKIVDLRSWTRIFRR